MRKTPAQLRASRNYNQKNKELINKKSIEYSRANPVKKKQHGKKYREQNREKIKQYGKEYYKKNKEKIAAKAKAKYLRLKDEREVNKKMFGNKKIKKVEVETPDLVVENPNMGMPGFTSDKSPQIMPVKTETGIPGFGSIAAPAPVVKEQVVVAAPAPVVKEQVVVAAPAPVSEIEEQYQIIAAELLPEGLFRYVIITNKNLGEVGGIYEA